MVKWWGPKVAVDAIHDCLLLHGHYGYTQDLPLEQRLRDVIGLEIGDGTAQVSKIVIARELLKSKDASRLPRAAERSNLRRGERK